MTYSTKRTLACLVGLQCAAAMGLAFSVSAQSMGHATQLYDGGKVIEAKKEFLALQKADDRSAAVAYYLGRIATSESNFDEAIRHFERALDLEDGNALYHFSLGSALQQVTPRASMIKMPFLARRMRKEWERAVELDPNQVDARIGLVQFYAMAPGVLGGNMDKAHQQAEEISKRNAMRGAIARATIEGQQKNAVAEQASYLQAIAAEPDSSAGYFALSNMYTRDGKAAAAFATLDQYSQRHPDNHWTMYYVGRVAGATGQDIDQGESALKQFLATPPSDAYAPTIAGAHYWLGQIAEKRGVKDAAREHYRTALKIDPKSQLSKKALEAQK
jgi:tetratricopeptide (TPR) repeat protein